MRTAIIGAGPAGSYAARELSENHDVTIFEDHFECGSPVQCTGILTHVGHNLVNFNKKFVDNKIKTAIIFAPNGKFVEVGFKRPNIIVNRTKHDQHLVDEAVKKGAALKVGHRYIGCSGRKGKVTKIKVKDVKKKKLRSYKVDYLVGADGPNSEVAKTNNMFGKREFFIGAQATLKLKNENQILFYPYVKDFGWAVPEDKNTMRIGIAARSKAAPRFKDFLKRFKGKIIDYQGGPIPVYNPKIQSQKGNVFLVGDSATQVKATTAGGIIQAMSAAKALARAINENPNNPNYEKEWKKDIGRDLYVHLQMRKMLDKFSNRDWNKLIEKFSSDKLSGILAEEDRDLGFKLGIKCLLAKPSLALYGRKLLL